MYGAINDPRLAFSKKDADMSKRIHDGRLRLTRSQLAVEHHTQSGELIKSLVYGAVDGVLTAFAIVTGGAGGKLSPQIVLVLGISSLFANAVSMGIGDIVSTLSYREHVLEERRREEWEFDNYPEGEIKEMVDLYESRGLPREKAEIVVATMAKYKDFFLDLMVTEELGLKIPGPKDNPYKSALAIGLSFFVFGLFPLLAYVLMLERTTSAKLFQISTFATLLTLFLLGAIKSKFSIVSWWRGGLEFCILGGLVAFAAYMIGALVSTVVKDFTV